MKPSVNYKLKYINKPLDVLDTCKGCLFKSDKLIPTCDFPIEKDSRKCNYTDNSHSVYIITIKSILKKL